MAVLQRLALRGTPKATKQAARYTPAGGAERCGMCRHYVPSSSCARIEGPVSAAGWCQLYSQQVTWRPRAGQLAGLNPGLVPPGVTLDLSFMAAGTLDPRITFTRASTATYFDSSGVMRTAIANTPRWDYDPVTYVLRGLLIEEVRTNVLLNSATLGTQSVTVTAQAYTLSFYGTGTITKSGTATGALVGTGAGQRVSQTFTPTAGTLTLTVTGSVLNAQLEAGAFATSAIITTAAAATRAVDIASMPIAASSPYSLMCEFYNLANAGGIACGISSDASAANSAYFGGQYWNYGGGTAYNTANTPLTPNAVNKQCGWLNNAALQIKMSWNGQVGPAIATTTTPGPGTVLGFGTAPWALGAAMLDGHLRRVRFWPRVLTDAELQSVTT